MKVNGTLGCFGGEIRSNIIDAKRHLAFPPVEILVSFVDWGTK